jgi:hypothetical protein
VAAIYCSHPPLSVSGTLGSSSGVWREPHESEGMGRARTSRPCQLRWHPPGEFERDRSPKRDFRRRIGSPPPQSSEQRSRIGNVGRNADTEKAFDQVQGLHEREAYEAGGAPEDHSDGKPVHIADYRT